MSKGNQTNRMEQVMKLDSDSYYEARKDDTGFYSPESLTTFEDYVNFEISVIYDQDNIVQSVSPLVLNGEITYIIVYTVENGD